LLGKLKKIGIGFGIVVLGFFAFGIIGSSLIQNNMGVPVTEQSETKVSETMTPKLYLGSVEDLLPDRNDIGTIWRLHDKKPVTKESEGFLEGIEETGTKGSSSFDITIITTRIYKFESKADVQNHLDNLISNSREKGGFEEWNPRVSSADSCYGKIYSVSMGMEKTHAYCIKDNIWVSSSRMGSIYDGESMTKDFVGYVIKKL